MLKWRAIRRIRPDWPDLPAGAGRRAGKLARIGPQENYPDRLTAACFDRWDLHCQTCIPRTSSRAKTVCAADARIELWPTPVARRLPVQYQRYSQQQLMETSHRHLLHAEEAHG